jgi:Helix-turn-helix domain
MPSRHPTPADFGLEKVSYRRCEPMEILSIGETTLHKLVKTGQLKCTKIGKAAVFLSVDLAAFIEKSQREGSPRPRPDRHRSRSSPPPRASDKVEPREAPHKLDPGEQGGAS